MHPGGPARSPLTRNGQNGLNNNSNSGGWFLSSGNSSPRDEYTFTLGGGGGGSTTSHNNSEFGSGAEDVDFLLAISSDEKMLRRLNEFDVSETVSTSGKGTDGKWKLDSEETVKMLEMFVGVV